MINYFGLRGLLFLSCSICEVKPGKYVCSICGRRVCEDDYVFEKKICIICAETLCEICGKYPSIGYCSSCGRLGCEDCLVQINLVSYKCRYCLRKKEGKGFENR